jgi:hypothetical protein
LLQMEAFAASIATGLALSQFQTGQEVEVQGLASRADLNGQKGIVVARLSNGRLKVKLESGIFALKPSNLSVLPTVDFFEPEDIEARKRRPSTHKAPSNWPRDVIGYCGYCDKSGHERNLACCAMRPEYHSGELEYVSWRFSGKDDEMGMAGVVLEEEEDVQKMYEEVGWDYAKMVDKWDNGFRWTCCGLSLGEGIHGCDHHGFRGRCSCDYCRGGQPYQPKPTQHNRFLEIGGKTEWKRVQGVPWTLELHKFFPKEFKESVKTLLLVNNRKEDSADSFSRIPSALLVNMIIPFLASSSKSSNSSTKAKKK